MDRLRSLGNSGLAITQGYGLTETSPTCHLVPTADAEKKVGFIGILLPNLEARLVVDDTRDAQEGEAGELWLRGPSVMKGYLVRCFPSTYTNKGIHLLLIEQLLCNEELNYGRQVV